MYLSRLPAKDVPVCAVAALEDHDRQENNQNSMLF